MTTPVSSPGSVPVDPNGAPAGRGADTPRRLRASHGFVTVGVALAVVAVIAGGLVGSGNADHLVELLPGRAWLANDDRGSVTLVNGATGSPEFEMRFRDAAGSEFEVVQGNEGVFVVNRTTGEITRIDGATQTLGRSIQVDVADEPLFLIGGGKAYLVLRAIGTIQEIDPRSPDLAPIGEPVQLGAAVGAAVVDDRGVLAAAVLGTGEIAFVEGATIAGEVALNPPGDPMTVTLVDGRVVAVTQDIGAGRVEASTVRPTGVERSQAIDVPVVGELVVAPKMDGARLWLLHAESATLAGVPLDGGEVRTLALDFARGDELGAPLPNGRFVYVPSFDQGALFKVDADTGEFLDIVPVAGDTGRFEAFVENGRVWGNDPVGGTAVVIDRDGNVQQVEKYQPGIPSNDAADGIPVPLDLEQPLPPTDPGARRGDGPVQPTGPDAGDRDDPGSSGPVPGVDDLVAPDDPAPPGGAPDDQLAPPSAPAVPSTPPDGTPSAGVPGVPGAVSAAAGDATATVSWLPALDNGSPILRYRVTASTGGTQTVDATTTTATFTGLTNGTPVSFSVHAENAIGVGPAATSTAITPMYAVPGAPTSVDFALTTPTFQAAVITVTWDLPVENPGAVAEWIITCTTAGVPAPYEFRALPSARILTLDTLPPWNDYFCGLQARAVDATRGPDVTMASGTVLRPIVAPPPPDCTGFRSVPRPPGSFRSACDLVAPSGTTRITGFIVEIFDGVSIIDNQVLPLTTPTWMSGVDQPIGGTFTILWYSYYTDPISGLTVTSEPNGQTI